MKRRRIRTADFQHPIHQHPHKRPRYVDLSDDGQPPMQVNGRPRIVNGRINGTKEINGTREINGTKEINGRPDTKEINGRPDTKEINGSSSIQDQRKQLPIFNGRDALVQEIRTNDVTILLGETGSGKTTQVPQYILESLSPPGIIAITQPRRVAATSLASRVSAEQQSPLGSLVGYAVRFDEKYSPQTKIKYMTDGMIVRELMSDPILSKYSVIIVDEAHERTLRTDLLLANLKTIQRKRNGVGNPKGKGKDPQNPLKIVVMSATLDAEKFSRFFHNAKILYIQGRQHPVTIYHSAHSQLDYVDAAMRTFFQVHVDQPPGDVLIFLPGQEDIESLEKSISFFAKRLPPNNMDVLILPMYASQSPTSNAKAFLPTPNPTHTRKCILATNIAETSITIPNVKYVIDTGKCKEKQYLARDCGGGFDTLLTKDITKSSAMQRTGRAGREGKGTCFRLYTEESFRSMLPTSEPEILRCSLTSSILHLKCINQNMEDLELMDKPELESIYSALKTLWLLGAIDKSQSLTQTGLQMSLYPLEPPLSRSILASQSHNCTKEILTIVSILSSSSKLFLPLPSSSASLLGEDEHATVGDPRSIFRHPSGDHMTILNICRSYDLLSTTSNTNTKKAKKEWCKKYFINHRTLLEASKIHQQLISISSKIGLNPELSSLREGQQEEEDRIITSLAYGLVANSAFLQKDGTYKQTMGHSIIKIHPSSTMSNAKVPAIIYDELVYTNHIYARGVSAIKRSFFLKHDALNQRQA